jgi:ankyrin repeat protein
MKRLADRKSRERVAVISVILLCALVAMAVLAPVALAQRVSFKPASGSPVRVGSGPVSVAVGDFNEDGINDMVVANANDNTISVFLGNGDGTFHQAPNSPIGVNSCLLDPLCNGVPLALAVGTFNSKKDQHLGIAVTNIPVNAGCLASAKLHNLPLQDVCSAVAILTGDGHGAFSGSNLPFYSNNFDTGGHLPTSVATGDFNNDGYADLAIANLDSGTVSILTGKGDGSFNSPSTIPVGSRPTSVAVGDFNGDQVLDLAVANGGDGTVTILTGNGDGTFRTSATFSVGNRPVSIAVRDLNGDGILDLAVANSTDSTVSVLLGNGNGTFQPAKNFGVGALPISVGIGDFNGDGKPDIAAVNRLSDVVTILLGDGSGSFAASNHIPVGNNPFSVAVKDFNGDGVDDIAVANLSSNTASVLLNNTDTTPPVTTAAATPGPNGNGWNNSGVAVTLTSTDSEPNGTGVKEIHYAIGSGTPIVIAGESVTVNFNTEGIFTLSYFAVDKAGNVEAAHSLTTRIDLTPPAISSSQSPPANPAGWNNSNVTVSFSCSDALSGIDTCTAPIVVSTEGAGQVETGTAADKAGNTATTTRTINLDKTPPVLTMPTLAPSYLLNSSLTLTFGAADALSGMATMQATLNGTPVTSGSTVTLTRLATNIFTLTAADVAGNTSTQTATFAVVYNFIGFLPPIPNDGSGLFKLGSTVPVKFQLTDAKGAVISTAVAHLTIQMISGNTLLGTPIDATASGNADVGDLFRFGGTQYVFNWSTKPVSVGTWQLQAQLDDGTVHTVVLGTK